MSNFSLLGCLELNLHMKTNATGRPLVSGPVSLVTFLPARLAGRALVIVLAGWFSRSCGQVLS